MKSQKVLIALASLAAIAAFVSLFSPLVQAAPQPGMSINSATVDFGNNTLTIAGSGFGSSLTVTLGDAALTVQTSNATQIVAAFPSNSPASGFAPGSYLLTVQSGRVSVQFPASLGAPASDVATLQQQVATLQSTVASLQTTVAQLQAALSVVEGNSVLALNGKLVLKPDGTSVQFSGVNVQVVNGMGSTTTTNGLGNLIVGYNETDPSNSIPICSDGAFLDQTSCTNAGRAWAANQHTGSHNLIIGNLHSYTQYGGMVVGEFNAINRPFAIISGGIFNLASGEFSSISGGSDNIASAFGSSISGGGGHRASGQYSSVSGGFGNIASGFESSISGGYTRTATGTYNWAAGSYSSPQ